MDNIIWPSDVGNESDDVSLRRFLLRRNKRVSYGTVIMGACIVPLGCLIIGSMGRCFTVDYWLHEYPNDGAIHKGDADWPFSFLRLLGFTVAICALPALGVVAHFQKRGKTGLTVRAAK